MNRTGLWCVVPAKRRIQAKQRLREVLNAFERARLVECMLEDVLASAKRVSRLAGIAVVTGDAGMAAICRRAGVRVIPDEREEGTCEAVSHAARVLEGEGATGILVLPGDIPAVSTDDIERILDAHGESPTVTLVPARGDGGTNALLVSPPTVIPFRFGHFSAAAHLQAARESRIEATVLERPRIALDVDRPADLLAFRAIGNGTRTADFLDSLGLEFSNLCPT